MQSQKTNLSNQIEITWPGKPEAFAQATAASDTTLELMPGHSQASTGAENVIIEGDNLDALKLLLGKGDSKVSAIYIDPPYNTGNGFVYRDRRDHAGWLSMMLPRLILARQLLSPKGAIFVSIDDHEVDKLRMLMAEVFGEENFVAQITIKSNPRGRQSDKHFAAVHEYLVVFARDHSQCDLAGEQLTEDQLGEFNNIDQTGRHFRLLGLRQRGAASLREDRPAMYYPVFVDPRTGAISMDESDNFEVAVYPKKSTGQPGRWMWGQQRARESVALLQARLIARRDEWDIFVRDYLEPNEGTCRTRKIKTIWDEKELNYQNGKRELKELLGEAPVDYPKPTALIKKIIGMIDDQNALFLDFFAGSGTLAQAVLESNIEDGGTRQFVLIQLPEKTTNQRFPTIADICRERVTEAVMRLNQQHQSDFGFNYYRLVHRN